MSRLTRGLLELGLSTLVLAACSRPVNEAECEKLLDHYTSLLVRTHDPDGGADRRIAAQGKARARAAADQALRFSRCTQEVSRRQLECALRARTPDRLEQCLL